MALNLKTISIRFVCATSNPVARSQAKQVLKDIRDVNFLELDFAGITEIGQGFADEVFRVFANQHPEMKLEATNTTLDVARMIRRARETER